MCAYCVLVKQRIGLTRFISAFALSYDALADLKFIKNEDGTTSDKVVDTMIAKDGEEVPLHEQFTMEGEVETYLNR